MSIAIQPFVGTYDVDRSHSSFQFAVEHMVATFRASFADVAGRLVADGEGLRLTAVAQAESVSISEPQFREHVVRGADFFQADDHPQLEFHSTGVELSDDGRASVTGELSVRGVTRTVVAEGTYRAPIEDPFGIERAGLELRATIDRRAWGMNWQLPLPGGGNALGWEVELTAELELVRAA